MTEPVHHTSDAVCPSCASKLMQTHPYLQAWFGRVKARYVNAHISWSYRGQVDQDLMFSEGKTKLKYPESPHNVIMNALPCSMALDLFQIDDDGNARFSPMFYAKLNNENETNREPIFWGGKWKSLGDYDHFEYRPQVAAPPAAA